VYFADPYASWQKGTVESNLNTKEIYMRLFMSLNLYQFLAIKITFIVSKSPVCEILRPSPKAASKAIQSIL
jgi:hypothetical protein